MDGWTRATCWRDRPLGWRETVGSVELALVRGPGVEGCLGTDSATEMGQGQEGGILTYYVIWR